MNLTKYSWWLLAISIFFSLVVIGFRITSEFNNSTVELVLDYDDVIKLEDLSGQRRVAIMDEFKEAGVLSIAISEDTLQKLSEEGRATIMQGENILNNSRIGQAPGYLITRLVRSAAISAGRYYVIIDENDLFRRAKASLIDEYGQTIVSEVGDKVLEIKGEPANFRNIGLGIDAAQVRLIQRIGFNVIPRIFPVTNLNEAAISSKIDNILELTKANTVIFSGDEVIGVNKNIDIVVEKLKEKKVNLGVIEFNKQKGVGTVARALPPGQTVGVHSIPQKQLHQLKAQIAVDRFSLAVNERGMRLLYIHPYLDKIEDIMAANVNYIQSIRAELLNKGFEFEQVKQQPFSAMNFKYNDLITLFISLAIVVVGFVFLKIYFPLLSSQVQYVFTGLLLLVYLMLWQLGELTLYRNIISLALSITVPVIAFVYSVPGDISWQKISDHKEKLKNIAKIVLQMIGITMVGVVLISGLLSDPYYMLKIRQFMGVKISYLLPPLLIAFYYLFYPNKVKAARFVFRRFLDTPITLRQLVVAGILVLFLGLYLVRSGNFSVPLIDLEINMRKILMSIFIVRPRTKEFLIGYPLIIMMLYYMGNLLAYRFKWIVAASGSIALVSLLNTFLHIHSPFLISIWRSVNGLILGVIISAIFILVINYGKKLYKMILF